MELPRASKRGRICAEALLRRRRYHRGRPFWEEEEEEEGEEEEEDKSRGTRRTPFLFPKSAFGGRRRL